MQWTEISVYTTVMVTEAINNILVELGSDGAQIDRVTPPATQPLMNTRIIAYFPNDAKIAEIVPKLKQRIQELPEFGLNIDHTHVETKEVSDAKWGTEWERYYEPQRITHDITIVPSWKDYQPQNDHEMQIRLDPGKAFGTGTHPTTQLAIQAMEITMRGNETLLDVGTGSGILSIAAKLLGAKQVYAYDNDDIALATARKNISLNPVAKDVFVTPNDLLSNVNLRADMIVANMLAVVLEPLIPQAAKLLKPAGHLILAGLIQKQAAHLKDVIAANKLKVVEELTLGDWVGLIVKKPGADE